MARRKRGFLDDGDSDSSAGSDADGDFDDLDPDAREERALLENPYKRRRRTNGKEDAIYGVFADDSEDEGFGGKKKGGRPAKRSDWAKAPSFVSGKKEGSKEDADADEDMEDGEKDGDQEVPAGGEDESGEEGTDDDDSEPSRAPSPRVREDEDEDQQEDEERPKFGGLGLGASKSNPPTSFSGFTKGGIGSSRPAANSESPAPSPAPVPARSASIPNDLPSAFGASRPQRSFVRDNAASAGTSRAATPTLSAAEQRHFSKLQGSFGARMLQKMGWQAGTGLGASGEGIVAPVESKLRPKNMGIAFKGFDERTSQSKAEARRRGEIVSDDEEEAPRRAGKAKEKGKEQTRRSDVWKKPKKVKVRIEHKTYEQIVAEAGQAGPSGVGIIIDATGATPREVSSLAEVSRASWTPTTDAERIPEVRHNIRLISETATGDLEALAREAKDIQRRRQTIQEEDLRLRKKVEEEAELIARLQQVHLVVDEIKTQSKELASVYEASLESLSPYFEKLLVQFPQEFDRYRLDEIVVAAIAPIVRRMFNSWSPLEEPNAFLPLFKQWRNALKLSEPEQRPPETQVEAFGSRTARAVTPLVEVPMTPFESLLWNAWLPKVRSAINNDWDPREPHAAIRLYESWSTFLPPFIKDNVLDQLILPKVTKAVSNWNPRKDTVSLKTIVFPWLPHVGLRLEEFLGDARRKLKGILRAWAATDQIPEDLATWKEVFDAGEWDNMLLKYIVPKLSATLREDFRVNPRQQDMTPLQRVLAWESLLRPSILGQILEAEFFPKWLDVLHIWLIQPRPSFAEVAEWYSFWKSTMPQSLQDIPVIQDGFTRGLQLMNKAIELGPDAPSKLPKPDHHRRPPTPAQSIPAAQAKKPPTRVQEITFRSIVEDFAASHNLMFVPAGRVQEKSRMPLFRVSPTADGKGGLLVYILDDAVWAPTPEGDYRAISLENMVLRATKSGI
ncbi:TFP11-domain-containing protein [Dentipellis sp. KUC8613]|nr:TFP11-domain-containing protein [Dentipellis sp. KUC8613]